MARLGEYDYELRADALYEPELIAEGWFDYDYIDVPTTFTASTDMAPILAAVLAGGTIGTICR